MIKSDLKLCSKYENSIICTFYISGTFLMDGRFSDSCIKKISKIDQIKGSNTTRETNKNGIKIISTGMKINKELMKLQKSNLKCKNEKNK